MGVVQNREITNLEVHKTLVKTPPKSRCNKNKKEWPKRQSGIIPNPIPFR